MQTRKKPTKRTGSARATKAKAPAKSPAKGTQETPTEGQEGYQSKGLFSGRIKPGEVRNTVGRKGHPNKVNRNVKEAFALLLDSKLDKLSKWIDETAETSPKDAVALVLKLSQYVIPKLNNEHITVRHTEDEMDYSKLTDEELETMFTLTNKARTNKDNE